MIFYFLDNIILILIIVPQKMTGGTDVDYKGLLNLSDCIDFCQVSTSDQRQKIRICKLSAKHLTSVFKLSFVILLQSYQVDICH